MAHGLERIDWSAPWLAPYRADGEILAAQVATGASVCAALNNVKRAPVQFVPQADLPQGRAYEAFIFNTRQCPTRDGVHDFFNGLCWLALPQIKLRLNQIQAHEIAQWGVEPTRGVVRDAATLFDENAAVLQGPDELWQALLAKDWRSLFVDLRPLWSQAWLLIVGHALLEKLLQPRKGMTAHVYRAQNRVTSLAELDAWLARDIHADRLAAKPFAPLPVLGVPGWWADNEDAAFYDDRSVFRAQRMS